MGATGRGCLGERGELKEQNGMRKGEKPADHQNPGTSKYMRKKRTEVC